MLPPLGLSLSHYIPSPFTGSEEPELKLINTWYSMAITGLNVGMWLEVDPITLNKEEVFIPQVGKKSLTVYLEQV